VLEAAAFLSNYQVAYHLLHTAARGVAAECVLIHTAARGVGSAAVQLALIAGMNVIGVAGSEAKRRAIEALGSQHAIDYRSEDVVSRVHEITNRFQLLSINSPAHCLVVPPIQRLKCE
jgi:NADPH2:quinone reductase